MAALLRVKRRNDDAALGVVVLACKRRKTDENDEVEVLEGSLATAIVKLAATVPNQEDDAVKHVLKTLKKDELKVNFKHHPVNTLAKAREDTKQQSILNRYKVVNCCRSLDTSNSEYLDGTVTVIDVEDCVSCSANQDSTDNKDDNYVYDLYYAQAEGDVVIDDVSVYPVESDFGLTHEMYYVRSENECESEDSNSESNWRNDYPDSDNSEKSIDEEDIREAMTRMRMEDEESDLSSEDDFVYAVDQNDVERYGYKYAKYKLKLQDEFSDNSNDSDDSNSYEYSDAI